MTNKILPLMAGLCLALMASPAHAKKKITFWPDPSNPRPQRTDSAGSRAKCGDPRCWKPDPSRDGARSTLTGGTR